MMVGGASLVSLFKEEEDLSSFFKWAVGEGPLQFNVNVEALAKAGELLSVWFSEEHPPLLIIYIFSSNTSALHTITNPQSKSHQAATIHFHKALTLFTLSHRTLELFLPGYPRIMTLSMTSMPEPSQLRWPSPSPVPG